MVSIEDDLGSTLLIKSASWADQITHRADVCRRAGAAIQCNQRAIALLADPGTCTAILLLIVVAVFWCPPFARSTLRNKVC